MLKKAVLALMSASLLASITACGETLPLAEALTANGTADLQSVVDSFTALSPDEQNAVAQDSGNDDLQSLMEEVQSLSPQDRQSQVYQELNSRPEMVSPLQRSHLGGYPATNTDETSIPPTGAYAPLRPVNSTNDWNNWNGPHDWDGPQRRKHP